MAINVTVSGSGQIVADVNGGSAADVSITSADVIGVGVTGGIGPAAYIDGTNTTVIGVHPVAAGANITVTTTSGSYTIIGRDVPVQSVQGRIGNVVLTLNDLTAAAQVHTHSTTQVVGLTAFFSSINHNHSTTDIISFTAAASNASPVQSVQGRIGNVVLTLNDLTAAAQVHTHSTTQVVGLTAFFSSINHNHSTTDIISFTAAASNASPVQSVQGRIGNVVLTRADLTAAAASHTHSTSEISGYTLPPVLSVQSRTGNVVLSLADLSAASVVHSHSTSQIDSFSQAVAMHSPVKSVNSLTGTLSIVASGNVSVSTASGSIEIISPFEVPDQTGASGRLLGSDGQDAGWYSLVAGSNITIVRNTNAKFIQVSASGGGGGGGGGGTALWPSLIFGG